MRSLSLLWPLFGVVGEPVADCSGRVGSVCVQLHGLWRVGFIHGFASRQQVEELLETLNEPHTVIFRFSSTQVDSLVISYLARQDEKTRHDLIKVSEGTLTTRTLCSIRGARGRLTPTRVHCYGYVGGFSTKNEHIRSSLKKVLRDTEEEYKVRWS